MCSGNGFLLADVTHFLRDLLALGEWDGRRCDQTESLLTRGNARYSAQQVGVVSSCEEFADTV